MYSGKRTDLDVILTGVNLTLLRSRASGYTSLSLWSLISNMRIMRFIWYSSYDD